MATLLRVHLRASKKRSPRRRSLRSQVCSQRMSVVLRCLCCVADDVKSGASSGWLSRLWKRNDTTSPSAVKANLGEQSSFYFDKELGKWVNKTVSKVCIPLHSSCAHGIVFVFAGGCNRVKTGCPASASACTDRVTE